jgi:hypothetical protein
MNSAGEQCFWCRNIPEDDGTFFKLCGACRSVRYCSVDCQRKDRKHHKEECAAIAEGKPRQLLSRAALWVVPQESLSSFPPVDDIVYFLKSALPHSRDVTISGPYWPLETLDQEIQMRIAAVGSDPGHNKWLDFVEEHSISRAACLIAALPKSEGKIQLEIIRHHNSEVATFVRNGSPSRSQPVYGVYEQLADPEYLTQSTRPSDHGFLPVLDARVHSVFVDRGDANRTALSILEQWKAEAPAAKIDRVDQPGACCAS